MAFSPNGEILASGSGDTPLSYGNRMERYSIHFNRLRSGGLGVASSSDGFLLPTAGIDQTIKLWTRKGVLLRTLNGHRSGIRAVAFHPQLPLLASMANE